MSKIYFLNSDAGVVYFNSCNGCIKCTVSGEWDKRGHHMSYPNIDAALRTDAGFRQMVDEDHHKEITPLVFLPIDMIKDFVVADSLHLLDLGIHTKFFFVLFNTIISECQICPLSNY